MTEVRTSVRYGFSVNLPEVIARAIGRLTDSAKRHNLFSAAAAGAHNLIQRHITEKAAPTHHKTADDLGATRSGHLEKGADAVTPHSTSDYAEVIIPIPGISRAFRDLTVTPKSWDYLTIPADAVSYGRRASEVRALGFSIFRPPAKGAKLVSKDPRKFSGYKNILMGSRDGEVKTLYSLAKSAHLHQDRGLLPDDEEISLTAKLSIWQYLQRRFAA